MRCIKLHILSLKAPFVNPVNPFKKLLILSPPFNASGGVSSYIHALKGSWPTSEKYIFRGNSGSNFFKRILLMVKEYLLFLFECLSFSGYNNVLINTSMGKKAMLRDSIFILIGVIFRKKSFLFIHGWDDNYFSTLNRRHLWFFFKSVKIFVLAKEFKDKLESKGYKKEIIVETTVVENDFIDFFNNEVIEKENDVTRILFLARLEPEKGVMVLIEAFKNMVEKNNNIFLDIAGTGSQESDVITSVKGHPNITYHGLVRGKQKMELFKKSQIYVLPTSHGEGMPISVLEAMAAGLIVITSSAGALRDFFIDGKMGYKMDCITASGLEVLLELAIKSAGNEAIGNYNYEYAREHVTVEKVIARLRQEIMSN